MEERHVLREGGELRLEVATDEAVAVTLQAGLAEVFGIELLLGRPYKLSGTRVAVYTHHGATLAVDRTAAPSSRVYISSAGHAPMQRYAQLHAMVHEQRLLALKAGAAATEAAAAAASGAAAEVAAVRGPRVLVAGPPDAGKSSLARILAAYAVRSGHAPTFVNLDVGDGGALGVPGAIAAAPLDCSCLEVESSGAGFVRTVPHAFWLGHLAAAESAGRFERLTTRLAAAVDERLATWPVASASGVIIDTCGWAREEAGLVALRHTIAAFSVDVILIVGDEWLSGKLDREFGATLSVVSLPKVGGLNPPAAAFKREQGDARVRRYFYGRDGALQPRVLQVAFDDVEVFRIGALNVSSDMVPVGRGGLDPERALRIQLRGAEGAELKHKVLAVIHDATGAKDVAQGSCAGWVLVKEVDVEGGWLTLLAPASALKGGVKCLVGGNIQWYE